MLKHLISNPAIIKELDKIETLIQNIKNLISKDNS